MTEPKTPPSIEEIRGDAVAFAAHPGGVNAYLAARHIGRLLAEVDYLRATVDEIIRREENNREHYEEVIAEMSERGRTLLGLYDLIWNDIATYESDAPGHSLIPNDDLQRIEDACLPIERDETCLRELFGGSE